MLTSILDRAGVISVEEGLRSGLTTAHVQRSAKYGGGFFVNVEGLHHLHCLVRQFPLMSTINIRLPANYIQESDKSLQSDRICCGNRYTSTTLDTRPLELTLSRMMTTFFSFTFVSLAELKGMWKSPLTFHSTLPRHSEAGPHVQRRYGRARSGMVQQG